MWHLKSFAGLLQVPKYVTNWYSVLAVYFKIIPTSKVKFKDGTETLVSRDKYYKFQEEFFRQYLQDRGFVYKIKGEKKMISTPDGLHIMYVKIPFSFFINEIFVAKVYGEHDLNGRVVIDGGTYIGDSSLYFVSRGASKVYGFEIDRENYNLAEENIKLNNMEGKIYIYNQKATYESIKNLINKYGLKNIFMKLDCEGCEYDIIMNTDAQTFENITDVVLEYHEQSEPLMQKLRELGFTTRRKKEIIYSTRKLT